MPMPMGMSVEEFQFRSNVSCETLERLKLYKDLLHKWQSKINLISSSTLDDSWSRHFLDSAQIYALLPSSCQILVDLGSGAGFPGMVLAIMGVTEVHLIESDQRKCAFLREVSRIASVNVIIHSDRIEHVQGFPADVITSRALAPVLTLLDLSEKFLKPETHCLFLKGQNAEAELTLATKHWTMDVDRFSSQTEREATLLDLHKVRRHDPA